LPHYPQLDAFVKGDLPNKYPGLQIQYIRGAEPIIKLLNELGEEQEKLSIDKWDTDTIVEFFDSHIERTDSPTTSSTNDDSNSTNGNSPSADEDENENEDL